MAGRRRNPPRDRRELVLEFREILRQGTPDAFEVATDLLLEQHLSLWEVSTEKSGHYGHFTIEIDEPVDIGHEVRSTYDVMWIAEKVGSTWHARAKINDGSGVTWKPFTDLEEANVLNFNIRQFSIGGDGNREAVQRAVLLAWDAVESLIWWAAEPLELAPGVPKKHWKSAVLDGWWQISSELVHETPAELLRVMHYEQNPSTAEVEADRELAIDKYKEFWRLEPTDIGEFASGFKIPTRVTMLGEAKWVTYRSGKVDPATLKKPKGTVDYIHEHDPGVYAYSCEESDKDTDVPSWITEVSALTLLGQNLGFCFVGDDDEEHEAKGTRPLPELYTIPSGKALLVIQDKRKVLAMMWGGALGVFARGIDG